MFALTACVPTSTPTAFVPPTQVGLAPATKPITTNLQSTRTISEPTAAPPCTDGLTFTQDLTIPDGIYVTPGQSIDKQWLVSNSGTCNWDARYRIKLINGNAMGAATEQAVYPARAGTQATIRIVFTAPAEANVYRSAWQAVGPDGTAFGDPIFIEINVSP